MNIEFNTKLSIEEIQENFKNISLYKELKSSLDEAIQYTNEKHIHYDNNVH